MAILGSHVPRRCGIATFTADLAAAISEASQGVQVGALAMSDQDYDYPPGVFAHIEVADRRAYTLAAERLNRSHFGVLSVQHEYGIYGGLCGEYLLDLLKKVDMPVVTTLHTILQRPTSDQRAVLEELIRLSTRLVVMSHTALDLLAEVHGVNLDKVDYIPHGIPEISSRAGRVLRAEIGGVGPILLTFGLLSPDKGIDNVIRALPRLVAKHPDTKYLVVGATHPHIQATMGESYRQSLIDLSEELEVSEHVEFVNEFVCINRLIEYLSATQFYITPYLNPMQITSGTLAYSMGAGKVVISTPYEYAKEVLADGRGILVPFRNPEAIAEAVINSCSDPLTQDEMGARAREYGSGMYWGLVGNKYVESFHRAAQEFGGKLAVVRAKPLISLPHCEPSLSHLETLTDDTGILQHATFTTANRREGYCVDDNARALLFTLLLEARESLHSRVARMQSRYLSFIGDALDEQTGKFRNFMSFRREWLEHAGSEDSQGRTMWVLGETVKRSRCPERSAFAAKLFHLAARPVEDSQSPRTWAYLILGAAAFLEEHPNDKPAHWLMETMADRLHDLYRRNAQPDWLWLEPRVAYANARIPQAMIKAGYIFDRPKLLEDGLASLTWLLARQTAENGDFAPVGCGGAGPSDFGSTQFDQQPIEAGSTVSACLTAHSISGQTRYFTEANRCFEWFLGRNVLGLPLANPEYGGCYDGLHRHGVNRNQGAESTLSYLSAFAELRTANEDQNSQKLQRETLSNINTIPNYSFVPAAIPS